MTAAQLCERFELSEAGKALLNEKDMPEPAVSLLADNGLDEDAVRLVAHAQPMKELIAWALACAKLAYSDKPPALVAVEAWLDEPGDDTRRAAFAASEKAKLTNPAGCLAAAVFFTGGNIAPLESPEQTPAPVGVAAQLASAAILLAATHGDPGKRAERTRAFLTPRS